METCTSGKPGNGDPSTPVALYEPARELMKGGARIRLQEQPFQILRLLLARAGGVVTREELRDRLWPNGTFVDFEHSLNAAVKRLRAALGDDAKAPRYIETLPRRGYRWIARALPLVEEQMAHSVDGRIQIVWN
jgi:DNA-binding winged helix-turn-helix (wHTH) protein